MKWKRIVPMSAAVLVLVILIIVITMRREERGLMVRECVAGEGVMKPLAWEHGSLPVKVWLAASEERLEPDVKKAIQFWAPYFVWAGYKKPFQTVRDPAVIVGSKLIDDDTTHGTANVKWAGSCRIQRVEIEIPMPMMRSSIRECAVAHEFGHALGLDHDDDEDSVMAMHRDARFRCEITKEDRAILLEVYGQ